MRMIVLLLFLFGAILKANAQKNVRDSSVRIIAINARWGAQTPWADMGERFGWGGVAGGGVTYKTKSNWLFQADYDFFYGKNVREDSILKNIQTKQGYILDNNGDIADVSLLFRGFGATGSIGRVFPLVGPNPNSGLVVSTGAGFLQHKIRIQENFSQVPALAGDYKKGYDRLSNGWVLKQRVGYLHHSNYRLVNFFIGAEFFEGFTQNRRTLNYDTGVHDGARRLDVVTSVVAQWNIPLYKKKPKEFYFY